LVIKLPHCSIIGRLGANKKLTVRLGSQPICKKVLKYGGGEFTSAPSSMSESC
jgi:hypothetical protein